MFLSIVAICITWYKIATADKKTSSALTFTFKENGQPINGFIEITQDGLTSRFKVVDGKIV